MKTHSILTFVVLFTNTALVSMSAVAADPLSLARTGDAVSAWKDNHTDYSLDEAHPGRIILGGFLQWSEPIYRFLVPAPVIASGICELQKVEVLTAGSGDNTWLEVGGVVNGQLSASGLTTLEVPLATAMAAMTTTDSKTYSIDLVVDVTDLGAQYKLDQITLRLTYSGYGSSIANCLVCYGAAQTMDTFNQTLLPISVASMPRKDIVANCLGTMRSLLMPSWTDVLPAPVPELLEVLELKHDLDPLTDFTQWLQFEPYINTYVMDMPTTCSTASASLRSLGEVWRNYIQNPGQVCGGSLNASVDQSIDSVNTLLNQVQHTILYAWQRKDDATVGQDAKLILATFGDLERLDSSGGINYASFLPSLAKTLTLMKFANLTLNSVNPPNGLLIAVAPADKCGGRDGMTPFQRGFDRTTTVTLSAPPVVGSSAFAKWQQDGSDWLSTPTVTVVMDRDHILTAVYSNPPDPGAPCVQITFPTTAARWTNANSHITLRGTASGNVVSVTWSNAAIHAMGLCTGTTNWSCNFDLVPGDNPIRVTAVDNVARSGSATMTVTYQTNSVEIDLGQSISGQLFSGTSYPIGNPGTVIDIGYDTYSTRQSQRALLQFDLSAMPPGATINSADLRCYLSIHVPTSGPACNASVYRVLDPWSQSSVNWANQPRHGEPVTTAPLGPKTGTWYAWDVTTLFAGWYGGTYSNNGTMMIASIESGPTESDWEFPSSTGTPNPKLHVVYTPYQPNVLIAITNPTATGFVVTTAPSLSLSGMASDKYGVSAVAWKNATSGQSGNAVGTTKWSATVPLVAGTNYITISATGVAGNSGSDGLTALLTTPPLAPTNVVATALTPSEALLTWNASQGPMGIQGYHIYRNQQLVGTTPYLQFSDTNIAENTVYCYTVDAYDLLTNISPQSAASCCGYWVPAITVTPASQDFGSIQVCTTADRSFIVQNTGGGTLSGSAIVSPPFSIVSGSRYNLTTNQTATVTVRYCPTSPGTNSQDVSFTGRGGAMRQVSGSAYDSTPIFTTTNPLPDGTVGVPYNLALQGAAGAPPYTFYQSTGNMPPGLDLGFYTGGLTGIPSAPGQYEFSLRLMDTLLSYSFTNFSLTIHPALPQFSGMGWSNGMFSFTLYGIPTWTYWIQASTNLTSWSAIYSITLSSNTVRFTDTSSIGLSARYYKALPFASTNATPHPADLNADYAISLSEFGEYANAYVTRGTWPIPPWPIPSSYLTNAQQIWQSNGYHMEPSLSPPDCWVPGK